MSYHHLDAPEYQGPGVTQLHDTAIEAGLVTAPERPTPDDVRHYNKQLQLEDDAKRKKQQQRQHDSDQSDELEEGEEGEDEEDEQFMDVMRERMLSELKKQHDTLVTAATNTANSSHLRDITEDEFDQHCLASSHHHTTLLLLHCNTPACTHMSQLLATLGHRYPAALRCVRLRATGDNIARFPLAACPTTMAYKGGRKVGQWSVGEWMGRGRGRVGGGRQVELADVVRELRQCGLLEAAANEEDEEAELEERGGGRLQIARGSAGRGGRRRGLDDSSDDESDG